MCCLSEENFARAPKNMRSSKNRSSKCATKSSRQRPLGFFSDSCRGPFTRLQVYADGSGGGTVAPYLYLDGTRGADGSSGLPAVPANVPLAIDETSTFSDEITFIYTVEFGDSSASAVLEVDEIRDGDALFVDILGREVDVSLDGVSLSAASSVSIDTAEPVVEAVGSTLNGGEYGVGQVRNT